MSDALLTVDKLCLDFVTRDGVVKALDAVSLSLARGETIGIVGESGSGKSVTAYAILGLLDAAARISGGGVAFGSEPILGKGAQPDGAKALRGREIAMIFQNPRVALNPIRPIGKQIEDVLREHADRADRGDRRAQAIDWLAKVRIPDPERRYHAYPFELSGGMCQRVMIALALACRPTLLIADEPTTGLDVTTQAAVMDLLRDLAGHGEAEGQPSGQTRMATILITHDLALAAEYCQRIVVMHAGHVVETAPVATLFQNPAHPYTRRLIATTPRAGVGLKDLLPIPGGLPDLRKPLPPCRYLDRCESKTAVCATAPLPHAILAPGHEVACHHPAS